VRTFETRGQLRLLDGLLGLLHGLLHRLLGSLRRRIFLPPRQWTVKVLKQ
jgi:hypothetical protein